MMNESFNAARGFVGGAAWGQKTSLMMESTCFNAARGFVGGATYIKSDIMRKRFVSMPHAAIPFRPHHRFAVPLPRSRRGGLVTRRFLVESRNISFPRRCGGSGERSEPMGALMPHAALWVVQPHGAHPPRS